MNGQADSSNNYPFSRPGHMRWLANHGLCDPQTAAEYVGRKLLSHELFARARKEYQEVTRNYAPAHHTGFTLRKPDEGALLEIWHIGLGPNLTYGALVVPRRTTGKAGLSAEPGQQSLVVRYGYPAPFGVETFDGKRSSRRRLLSLKVSPNPGKGLSSNLVS